MLSPCWPDRIIDLTRDFSATTPIDLSQNLDQKMVGGFSRARAAFTRMLYHCKLAILIGSCFKMGHKLTNDPAVADSGSPSVRADAVNLSDPRGCLILFLSSTFQMAFEMMAWFNVNGR